MCLGLHVGKRRRDIFQKKVYDHDGRDIDWRLPVSNDSNPGPQGCQPLGKKKPHFP